MANYIEGETVSTHPFKRASIGNRHIAKGTYVIEKSIGEIIKLRGVEFPIHVDNLFSITYGEILSL